MSICKTSSVRRKARQGVLLECVMFALLLVFLFSLRSTIESSASREAEIVADNFWC